MSRHLGSQKRFFPWRLDGRVVAFTFCLETEDTLYDMDIGLDYSAAHDLHLYCVTRCDMIEWATDRGLKRYICPPFGYDPKLHMRMDLVPLAFTCGADRRYLTWRFASSDRGSRRRIASQSCRSSRIIPRSRRAATGPTFERNGTMENVVD